jgi:hypothetical protein
VEKSKFTADASLHGGLRVGGLSTTPDTFPLQNLAKGLRRQHMRSKKQMTSKNKYRRYYGPPHPSYLIHTISDEDEAPGRQTVTVYINTRR